ncbi:hypothetical protein LCM19_09475 [Qipengyuania flava]|nr:hypothetical protein [Qipengyuania flava]
MKKTIFALSAAAAALTGTAVLAQGSMGKAAPAADVTRGEAISHATARFERMDVNKDGVLDAADRAARAQQRFAKADTNGDGELSQSEMTAMHQARKNRRSEANEARAEQRQARMAERFARMDADQSGGLSQAELKAMHEMRGKRGGEAREERRGGKRGHHGRGGMRMLAMADSNGDKAISRTEFTAAATARFDRADANGDGTVTAAERKEARETRRAEWQAKRQAAGE